MPMYMRRFVTQASQIDFIGICDFTEKLNSKDFGVKKAWISDCKLYKEKYYFESYISSFLKNLISENESKLFLTLSKPVDNHIIAIIGNCNPQINGLIRTGLGMKLFFKFDSTGMIEEVLYSSAAYN